MQSLSLSTCISEHLLAMHVVRCCTALSTIMIERMLWYLMLLQHFVLIGIMLLVYVHAMVSRGGSHLYRCSCIRVASMYPGW